MKLILIYFILAANIIFCQNESNSTDSLSFWFKKIQSENPNKNVFIVGENHFRDNIFHKTKILENFDQLKVLALEVPINLEYLCNQYILNNDSSVFDFSKSLGSSKNEFENTLRVVRQLNVKREQNNKINIICFDLPSSNFKIARKSLVKILQLKSNIHQIHALNILMENPSNNDKKKVKLINKLLSDLNDNDSTYQCVLSDFYYQYKSILLGLQIFNNTRNLPFLETLKQRETFIKNILEYSIQDIKNNQKMIIFCGNAHTSKISNDKEFFESNNIGFTSFTSQLLLKYPNLISTMLVQYSSLYFKDSEKNYINIPHSVIFKTAVQRFAFYSTNELSKIETFKNRSDYLLIINLDILNNN